MYKHILSQLVDKVLATVSRLNLQAPLRTPDNVRRIVDDLDAASTLEDEPKLVRLPLSPRRPEPLVIEAGLLHRADGRKSLWTARIVRIDGDYALLPMIIDLSSHSVLRFIAEYADTSDQYVMRVMDAIKDDLDPTQHAQGPTAADRAS